jgi:SAM-dependent methyltransferase
MPNQEQVEYWNARAGEKWAALQPALDAMLTPVTETLLAKAGIEAGMRVLDIGCGCGETSVLAARRGADVTGVDISGPMLAVARARGEGGEGSVRFIEADASQFRDVEGFDIILSRFGIMFFDDPDSAFGNLRALLKPKGRLVFACWQDRSANEWATAPMRAIADLLPETPPADPYAPGPFALADAERLRRILTSAGYGDVSIETYAFPVTFAASGGAEAAADFGMQIGPAAAAAATLDADTRREVRERLRDCFSDYEKEGAVRLGGAAWLVAAS